MLSNDEWRDIFYELVEDGKINRLEAEMNICLHSGKGIDPSGYSYVYKIHREDIFIYNGTVLYGEAFSCEYNGIAVFDYDKFIQCKMKHQNISYYKASIEVDKIAINAFLTDSPFIVQKFR